MKRAIKTPDEFWAMVRRGNADQCWPWLGSAKAGGRRGARYGSYWDGRWQYFAHRYAYTVSVGPIPVGMDLMHACDNTLCCNPAHLNPGTRSENMQDMIAKGRGRWARGEAHGLAKLTPERAQAVFDDHRPYKAIAEAFGVSFTCVGDIKRGRTWSHVTGKKRDAA